MLLRGVQIVQIVPVRGRIGRNGRIGCCHGSCLCSAQPGVSTCPRRVRRSKASREELIAAHIRERRYELELTRQDVAERAGTSHSFIRKVEGGDHVPTIPVLKRILAVLDEELLIGIERTMPDEEPEREIAPAPDLITA